MREIKFRGKDIKNGEWVYGDLHLLCNAPHIHTQESRYPFAGIRSFVNKETIGQFTGLHDKNGKEIYEGDIIVKSDKTFETKLTGVVVYNSELACFYINYEKYGIKVNSDFVKSEDYNDGYSTVKCEYEYDVIGNIYDNFDLMK